MSSPLYHEHTYTPQNRVKMAEAMVAEEKEEGERALLQRLFPDVRVVETTSFSSWVDQFEMEAQLCLDNTKKQVTNTPRPALRSHRKLCFSFQTFLSVYMTESPSVLSSENIGSPHCFSSVNVHRSRVLK